MPDTLRPLMQADLQGHQGTLQPAIPLPEGVKLGIPGAHNVANASLAYTVGHVLGVEETTLRHALETFEAVEGRLQKCGEAHGRTFYNDSNATTQEATLAALRAFPADKLVLIFGGADKGLPIDELVAYVGQNAIRAVLLQGTGSTRVLATLPNLPVATSMQDAMARAVALSRPGDVVVLSPAFASFGMFTNEYDRSDQYLAAVKAYVTGPTP
jgi:UDP-N-acetylmuramoylalanine--D-glutamate ligase